MKDKAFKMTVYMEMSGSTFCCVWPYINSWINRRKSFLLYHANFCAAKKPPTRKKKHQEMLATQAHGNVLKFFSVGFWRF